jgi:hypothetical protein
LFYLLKKEWRDVFAFRRSGKRSSNNLSIKEKPLLVTVSNVDAAVIESRLVEIPGEGIPILIGTPIPAHLDLENTLSGNGESTVANTDGVHKHSPVGKGTV